MPHCFANKTDEEVEQFLLSQGFMQVRKLEDGEWIGLLQLAFTLSVCMGIEDITPFKYRWCFANPLHAFKFFNLAEDYDEIPCEEYQQSLKGHRHQSKALLILNDENGFPRWK